MTDIAVPEGNLPATVSEKPEGLEDFGKADQVMPTLRIEHKKAIFVDSLSGQEYQSLEVVLLGLIKQRVLWPSTVGDDKQFPLCRSYNFDEGHPSDEFPWAASGFTETGGTLPCENCKLKDWNSHPTREAPWCSEQHTFAALVITEEGDYIPVLLQMQRSGLKSSRAYMSSFNNAGKSLFTAKTRLTLEAKKRGNNDYAVPKFVNSGATEAKEHPFFSQTYRGIRTFLQTPRTFSDDDGDDDEGTPVSAPTAPPASAGPGIAGSAPSASPAPAAAAPAADGDEDLPF